MYLCLHVQALALGIAVIPVDLDYPLDIYALLALDGEDTFLFFEFIESPFRFLNLILHVLQLPGKPRHRTLGCLNTAGPVVFDIRLRHTIGNVSGKQRIGILNINIDQTGVRDRFHTYSTSYGIYLIVKYQ